MTVVKKINITKCAEQLEVSRVTVYSYIDKGLIVPKISPAGKKYFLQEDIDALSEKLRSEGEVKNDRV